MKYTKSEKDEARARLLSILKPGDTVYTVLRHVSRSGMQRRIDLYSIDKTDGSLTYLTRSAAVLGSDTVSDKGGIIVNGCGMDMGFSLVSNLSRYLWPDGFTCIGERGPNGRRCPSNDHMNGDRDYTPHHHKSGGYALRHEWI